MLRCARSASASAPSNIPWAFKPSFAATAPADAPPAALARSNPSKRAVYDLYGHEGLRAGLQVGPRLKSREEIRAEFEAVKAARDARAAAELLDYRGNYVFGARRRPTVPPCEMCSRWSRRRCALAPLIRPPLLIAIRLRIAAGFSATELLRPSGRRRGPIEARAAPPSRQC